MDEIEIKRGDAEHEHQDCGYEDPQDTLDYKSSILWDHNDLRPIGASQKYTGGSKSGTDKKGSDLQGRVYS